MFIGVYLCSSGIILVLTLLVLSGITRSDAAWGQVRQQWGKFIMVAAGFIILGLALFILLSGLTDGLAIGAGSYGLPQNYPQDYIEYGAFGWLVLAVSVTGIFSPALVALWLHHQSKL